MTKKIHTSSNSNNPVRLAVIGVGTIGRKHAEIAAGMKECRLVAISDVDTNIQMVADELKTSYYSDYIEMIENNEIDGVIVAVPNKQHAVVGTSCAQRGLHILMEKPIAADLSDADRLIDSVNQHHVCLLVGHYRRFNPHVETVRKMIQEGQIGRLVGANVLWAVLKSEDYFQVSWRKEKGGGPIIINLIHDIDNLRFICGEVSRVYAEKSNQVRNLAVEDSANVSLRFASGAMASIFVSDTVPSLWSFEATTGENPKFYNGGENCYTFFGTEGSITFPHIKKVFYRDPTRKGWKYPLTEEKIEVLFKDPYKRQLSHFCKVIRGKDAPRTSGEDARKTLEVVMSVIKSCETGQPVNLR